MTKTVVFEVANARLIKEGEAYCLANVGRSVDQMVSDHYLENFLLQSFHISHTDWSW